MAATESQAEYAVKVVFDTEDEVWVVDASDIPGLYLAHRTLDGLIAAINEVAPQLLAATAGMDPSARFHIDIPDSRQASQLGAA